MRGLGRRPGTEWDNGGTSGGGFAQARALGVALLAAGAGLVLLPVVWIIAQHAA